MELGSLQDIEFQLATRSSRESTQGLTPKSQIEFTGGPYVCFRSPRSTSQKDPGARNPGGEHVRLKAAVVIFLSFTLALILSSGVVLAQNGEARERNNKAPIELAGVIAIPGNPLVTSDIVWVDPGTKKFYFADRSNFGVDVIDAENNLFVGRISGFAGPQTSRGHPNANATTPPPDEAAKQKRQEK